MKKVSWFFALRFLFNYLRRRAYSGVDANRIAKAADAGVWAAKPVDWLMMRLSVSYGASQSFRRGLEQGLRGEGSLPPGFIDSIGQPKEKP